jgi:hypothetical protein
MLFSSTIPQAQQEVSVTSLMRDGLAAGVADGGDGSGAGGLLSVRSAAKKMVEMLVRGLAGSPVHVGRVRLT